jgi:protoporphyrinogen oxidase
MEQFFLKTFGEGISNLYLTPYNRKVWKFEPSYLDTQMVDRIPKPPRDDVISSASGKTTEGYVHQLYFHYPTSGGFQTLVNDYEARLGENVTVKRNFEVSRIQKNQSHWIIESQSQLIEAKTIVSTLPLPKLVEFLDAPKPIRDLADQMKYNSIHIVLIELSKDVLVDQFALYIPDEDVSFHRLSRLNFLGENYVPTSGGALLMAEITFRKDMKYANWKDEEIIESVLVGLKKLSIIENEEVLAAKVITFEHAYVIYDINHRSRTDTILEWVNSQGIMTTGRFGKFEYQNSDQVVYESINLRKRIMENFNA